MLCHNIDVIHIEKNVVDNIIGTLLNMENKTKDNLKARLDLKKKKSFVT
jgi:Zn-finger protein